MNSGHGLFRRPGLAWSAGLALAAALGIAAYLLYASNSAVSWLTHTYQVEAAIKEAELELVKGESVARLYVIRPDPSVKAQALESFRRTDEVLARIDTLVRDNESQIRRNNALRQSVHDKNSFMRAAIAAAENGKDAKSPIGSGKGVELIGVFRRVAQEMIDEEHALLKQRQDRFRMLQLLSYAAFAALGSLSAGFLWMHYSANAAFLRSQETERQRIERLQLLLSSVLQNMQDAIVVADNDGKFLVVNQSAEQLLGTASQPESKEEWSDYYGLFKEHGSKYEWSELPLIRAINGQTVNDEEIFVLGKDGKTKSWISVNATPFNDASGRQMGGIAVFRDISYRKEMTQQLNLRNEELERAVRAKDVFLAGMSHELRTPLNSILGFVGILLMKLPGPLNAEQERQLKVVQNSSRHLLSLINDILDLAKIESGKVELSIQEVDVNGLVNEVVEQLIPLAQPKHLEVIVKLSESAPILLADRRALSQVLINLINNAIKFTSRGSVTVVTSRNAESDDVRIDVIDTGPGVPEEQLQKLFLPFERIGRQTRQEGSGLGLHLSRRLLDLMGGKIEVESVVGKGSRFSVLMPAVKADRRKENGSHTGR